MCDIRTRTWDPDLCELLGVPIGAPLEAKTKRRTALCRAASRIVVSLGTLTDLPSIVKLTIYIHLECRLHRPVEQCSLCSK